MYGASRSRKAHQHATFLRHVLHAETRAPPIVPDGAAHRLEPFVGLRLRDALEVVLQLSLLGEICDAGSRC